MRLRTCIVAFIVTVAIDSPVFVAASDGASADRPNIVWIIAEDASPHIGCYGETTIRTPHLDQLAKEGVMFTQAFVTSPVCSPSRSAMVSGMYPTTLGAHNHRSQVTTDKGKGNRLYYDSFRLPETIQLIPELFAQAGYFVVNGGAGKDDYDKEDYNFVHDKLYRGKHWTNRAEGQPFFAQIQLHGGKNRGVKVANPVSPAAVTLPPYYADDPVLRTDWAQYLNSWIASDNDVGTIIDQLGDEGVLDNTVVFFWTDHGISHLRGKQFLYDEGIHVPLIVRFPRGERAGTLREDLVTQIDVAATSLDLAGIPIPQYVQGKSIFSPDYQPREEVFGARDRCDETVDIIRSVRTPRFKYIRNFLSYISHMQPSSYKDAKLITQVSRELHVAGKLNDLQNRIFAPTRPPEELYDLDNDPNELVNLAMKPEYQKTLLRLRDDLRSWMIESHDLGLIPEPILEDLGRQYGNKSAVLMHSDNAGLQEQLLAVFDGGEAGDLAVLKQNLKSDRAAIRYWAATWLGVARDASAIPSLQAHLTDKDASVRIAAALALHQLRADEGAAPLLVREIDNENLLVGMYSLRALEEMGVAARPALSAIREARTSDYEYNRRLAKRLSAKLDESTVKNR